MTATEDLRLRRHAGGLAARRGTGSWRALPGDASLDALLAAGREVLWANAAHAAEHGPELEEPAPLAPVESQEVWAAGVTYERSRDARVAESEGADAFYERIYDADRPELFFKSAGWRVVAPGAPIGVRADATWSVPEPELAVVLDAAGEVAGFTVGNDVSSRDIEAANPLYLPQAKVFEGSCALGPDLLLTGALEPVEIGLRIERGGEPIVDDRVSTAALRRPPSELATWLFRALRFPVGAVLLTGTGLVPDDAFGLQAGDRVAITIEGLGTLSNPVELVGAAGERGA